MLLNTPIITVIKYILIFVLRGGIDCWILMSVLRQIRLFPISMFPIPRHIFLYLIGMFSCLSLADVILWRGIIFMFHVNQAIIRLLLFQMSLTTIPGLAPVGGTSLCLDSCVVFLFTVCVCVFLS